MDDKPANPCHQRGNNERYNSGYLQIITHNDKLSGGATDFYGSHRGHSPFAHLFLVCVQRKAQWEPAFSAIHCSAGLYDISARCFYQFFVNKCFFLYVSFHSDAEPLDIGQCMALKFNIVSTVCGFGDSTLLVFAVFELLQ